LMTHHYTNLLEGKANQRKVMRNYGATNEAYFFAVATDSFF
jgi:Mlc titration factor MtfA (ptsG expression regulator)